MRTKKLVLITVLASLAAPTIAAADFDHVVTPGESLTSIASTDGLSVPELAAANGLAPDTRLTIGASIAIPPLSTGSGSEPATVEPATTGYLVQAGDTLSAIAARYGTSVDALAADNGLAVGGVLMAGTTLNIPTGAPAAPSAVPTTVAAGAGPQATDESASASEIGSIANQLGVPASLAEAVAYQESGFDNDTTSSTGAVGVMQIEPATWNYVGSELGEPGLASDSVADNIRAGVALLHELLTQTGGDERQAAAAYYQGLQSVRQHGMDSDTSRYVENVMALQQRFGGP